MQIGLGIRFLNFRTIWRALIGRDEFSSIAPPLWPYTKILLCHPLRLFIAVSMIPCMWLCWVVRIRKALHTWREGERTISWVHAPWIEKPHKVYIRWSTFWQLIDVMRVVSVQWYMYRVDRDRFYHAFFLQCVPQSFNLSRVPVFLPETLWRVSSGRKVPTNERLHSV